MRGVAGFVLLACLVTVGCSGGEAGPRAIVGSGGQGAGGASVQVGGASNTAGIPSTAGTPSSGGAPITTGGSTAQGGSAPVGGTDDKAHVISWVPPYRVDESKTQLSTSFDGVGMADGLSFLALQFWVTDGPATRLDQVTEGDITWFHDWARQHGVKILLCVHNHTNGDWNWPEAVRAFKDNREAFAQHLVSQVMTRDLDGVDLDLEGIVEATADDQESYKQFVTTISSALRASGKTLTVDSFHGQWNAPNWNWWPDLFPLVDGITSMGYEQSGMGVDYEQLVEHAAAAPHKLMIGVPSYQGSWQNHTVGEQLGWLLNQGQVGTAIWDAALMAPEWRSGSVWNQLKAIKLR